MTVKPPLRRNSTTPTEFFPVAPDAGSLQNHNEYMDGAFPLEVRPAHWSMKEIKKQLIAMKEDGRWDGNTRYLSLKGNDSDYNSTIPTMWVTVHLLRPGECIEMHRHTPGSVYHVISGTGYSTINEYRIDWEAGDTFSCPSNSYHEHWNTGTEDSYMWTVQDLPIYSYNRMATFQFGDSEKMDFLHKSRRIKK
ncbi:cupin domain-containing protein [Mesorhizobium sp. CA8]|uniref:cupin domain-containing protein n=1 Tax=unclassified Mesorhizobium TaxID=325217 RepID=UPI001CC94979|nr:MULTISPECIES: cupin domain-containing protein [unclassified Mesorhizobium]MBZ9761657.1 cupin domain-containing protein [Mesorhizobium sp. CA8]MBZ9820589.1 cupin domain-containing protein [Mesorhizobium sp. CA4]